MMSINNSTELRAAIERLELKKKSEEKELIVHFHETVEYLKPANMIKSAIGKIIPANILGTVLKTAGTVGVGLLTSKIAGGTAVASTGKKLFSSLLSQTASHAAVNNIDKIKAYGIAIFNTLFKKKV
jgi:hypothetical protein